MSWRTKALQQASETIDPRMAALYTSKIYRRSITLKPRLWIANGIWRCARGARVTLGQTPAAAYASMIAAEIWALR
jgi:hypothetical protein